MYKVELVDEKPDSERRQILPKCRKCICEVDISKPYIRITLYSSKSKFRIFFHAECAERFAEEIIKISNPEKEQIKCLSL